MVEHAPMSCPNGTAVTPRPGYQRPSVPLAVSTPGAFKVSVAQLAFHALRSPRCTEMDRQLCHDLRRDDRYAFRAVDRALDLVAGLPRVQAEAVLAEFSADLRASVLRRMHREEQADLGTAYAEETASQGDADNAQLAVVREVLSTGAVSSTRLMRARTAVSRHAANLVRFLDDLAQVPVRTTPEQETPR